MASARVYTCTGGRQGHLRGLTIQDSGVGRDDLYMLAISRLSSQSSSRELRLTILWHLAREVMSGDRAIEGC